MPNCAVYGCNNNNRVKSSVDIKFYKFPKIHGLALEWIKACCRQDKINLKNAVICSKHFENKSFVVSLKYKLLNETPPRRFRNLLPDAIPTLFLPQSISSNKCLSKRSKRMQTKNNLQDRRTIIEEMLQSESNNNNTNLEEIAVQEEVDQETINMSELMIEIQHLEIKVNSLEKEVDDLKSINEELIIAKAASASESLRINTALSNHFTSGQIKRMLNPNKKYSSWAPDDISSAISLRSVSPKAYRYLKKNGYPLPALSTLRRWAVNLELNPGILTDVVKLMKQKSTTLNGALKHPTIVVM